MYYIRVIRECLCRNLVRCEHIQYRDWHLVRMTSRLGTDMTSPVPANEASRIPWIILSAILTPFWIPQTCLAPDNQATTHVLGFNH
ncbi:hypothetical protein J6590_000530 [Homalodisca vitripennis]|nr:hypothetical protein J6590_000530 [Homalodisca vitripennis]